MPLKFPDARVDCVMLISYVIDGSFFLIVNWSILSKNIEEFDYSPKLGIEGHVTVYNVENEKAVLQKFF